MKRGLMTIRTHDAVVFLAPANVAAPGLHNGRVKVMLICSKIFSTDIPKIDSHTAKSVRKPNFKRIHLSSS